MIVELGHFDSFPINFLGNIVMFMPIGFFVPLLWEASNRAVILTGLCTSACIEFCQLFLRRGTDVDDLILNTAGTALGLLIYEILRSRTDTLSQFRETTKPTQSE